MCVRERGVIPEMTTHKLCCLGKKTAVANLKGKTGNYVITGTTTASLESRVQGTRYKEVNKDHLSIWLSTQYNSE